MLFLGGSGERAFPDDRQSPVSETSNLTGLTVLRMRAWLLDTILLVRWVLTPTGSGRQRTRVQKALLPHSVTAMTWAGQSL